MSVVGKDTIQIIAQSVGISNLGDDVAAALAPDVEYRMREIMQEAIKCMRHSKRSILTTDDVNSALSLRNVEVIEAPFPKAPFDASVVTHWLAVEGVQPAIPENAPIEPLTVPTETKKVDAPIGARKDEDSPVDVKTPVKHVLSRELQLYFEKITELIVTGQRPSLLTNALMSLSTDSGLHPLVPYFTQFVADEVIRSLDNFTLLFSLMRVVQSLLLNPHIHIEPYLHQLMPSVITCLVAKRIGGKALENHWELRDFTASIVAFICKRFGHAYQNLQQRVTRTLVLAFLDPKRAMTQHYGAITGLSALGSRVVQLLILPNLSPYLQLLAPEMSLETQPNEMKQYEAWRVYGALQFAAGKWLYNSLKSQPELLSSTPRSIPKVVVSLQESQASVTGMASPMLTSSPSRKRAAGTDLTNPSLPRKFSMDNDIDMSSMPSTITDSTEVESGLGGRPGEHGGDTDDRKKDRSRTRIISRKFNPLAEAWKEDSDIGLILTSLVDLFGEGIFPFIPTTELSLFL